MKKRLLALLLCVALVASLLTVAALADSGDISYDTEITTSKVSVGVNNYYCMIDPQTWEIYPFILIRQGNQLVSDTDYYAENGDAVKVYPNKWAHVNERGYFYYIETAKGNGYMLEMYLNIKHCEVTFDANGGQFDDGSTEISYNIPYEEPYSDLPTPYLEGYTFEGWRMATDSGEWAIEGSPVISSFNHTLYANWHLTTCTVYFDLNGMPGTSIAPIDVNYGETITLPTPENVPGYTFVGWYFNETKWENTTPVTGNIILSARWEESTSDPETPPQGNEVDVFNFINADQYFDCSNYALSGRYLSAMQDVVSAADWVDVEEQMNRDWGGSCYGMSAVFILNWFDDLDPGFFQSGSDLLHDLSWPSNNSNVLNLINYYHLQQYTEQGSNGFYYSKLNNGDYNKELVEIMKSGDVPVMISFLPTVDSGHAIVGLNGVQNGDGSYSITVYDPNQWRLDTMTISADYRSVSFASGNYPSTVGVINSKPASSRGTTYDHANLQDYFTGGLSVVKQNMYKLNTELLNFTITAANGQYATFTNGIQTDGSLSVQLSIALNAGYDDNGVTYILPASSAYTINVNSGEGYISLTVGKYNVAMESNGISTLALTSDGKVDTSAPKSVEQMFTLTSDEIGNDRNSVTLSGEDNGFSLSAYDGIAEANSENDKPITLTSSNVFTDEQDNPVEFESTSGGVIYEVDKEEMNTPEPDQNPEPLPEEPDETLNTLPFTDVNRGDWFYDYVDYVYANGLMDGVSDASFNPNGTMSRAMVWAILARIDGQTVTGESWIEAARAWAMSNGISDGTDPNGLVTREQFATMLWRYAGEPGSTFSLAAYTDAGRVSDWAQGAMRWAVEKGIITGVTETEIDPHGTATRAQAAAMLMRFMEDIK